MSGYEEKIYRTTKTKPNIADLKSQLARLRSDLENFTSRKSPSRMIAPLQERIREVMAEIAAVEDERRGQRADKAMGDNGTEPGVQATSGHFAARGRRGTR